MFNDDALLDALEAQVAFHGDLGVRIDAALTELAVAGVHTGHGAASVLDKVAP